jgi:hypothetical protein
MSSNVLADRDINASVANVDANAKPADGKADVKSMEYHRQVLQSKLDEGQYVLIQPSILFSLFLKLKEYLLIPLVQ